MNRSKALASLNANECSNVHLALNRLLVDHTKNSNSDNSVETSVVALIKDISKDRDLTIYRNAYESYIKLQQSRQLCEVFTGTLRTPLAIGLGSANPIEVGLTLHPIYGMPVIPGSALKGMCRRACRAYIDENPIENLTTDMFLEEIFGDTSKVGACTFWDAWYIPKDTVCPFQKDIITVHHPEYYNSRGGERFPTDFDDPTPIPFVSVKPKTQFYFAIDASGEWKQFFIEMLKWGLVNIGIGAKTNTGYGYFESFTTNVSDIVNPPSSDEGEWHEGRVIIESGQDKLIFSNANIKKINIIGSTASELKNILLTNAKPNKKISKSTWIVEALVKKSGNSYTIDAFRNIRLE